MDGLMKTTMESLKDIVDVNKIVGDPVETPDGSVIIPVSKLSFGYAAGGGEYEIKKKKEPKDSPEQEGSDKGSASKPFAGGSGAGVTIRPVAFLVVGQGQIKLLPVDTNVTLDKVIDLIPELMDDVQSFLKSKNNTAASPGVSQ